MDASMDEFRSDAIVAIIILVFTLVVLLVYKPHNTNPECGESCDKAVQGHETVEHEAQTRLTTSSLEMLPRLKSTLALSILRGVLPPGGVHLTNDQGDCNRQPFGAKSRMFDEISNTQLKSGVMKNILALMTANQIKNGWDAADTWYRWQLAEKNLAGTWSEKTALEEKLQRHGISPANEGMPRAARGLRCRHVSFKAKRSNCGYRSEKISTLLPGNATSQFLTDAGRVLDVSS